jgi:hypothetical protein
MSQILNETGRSLAGKQQERDETGQHGGKGAQADGDELLGKGHSVSPAFSMGFLKKASIPKMQTMVGIMKDSALKTRRQKTEQKTPIKAV